MINPQPRTPQLAFIAVVSVLVVALSIPVGQPRCSAAPVSPSVAKSVVQRWLYANPLRLGKPFSNSVSRIDTYRDPSGIALYHVVSLAPQGYVIVAADNRLEPILSFSATGFFDPSPANPLVALLNTDVPNRLARAALVSRGRDSAKWQSFFAGPPAPGATSMSSISDVWVAPFVQTQWNQGFPNDVECYNFYTPNNDYTGCVATALAQLMRYYEWPQKGVGTASLPIEVDGNYETAKLRGGDGAGGPYVWSEMPYTPDLISMSTADYDEVGDISADAGTAVYMEYSASGSGAYMSDAQSGLKDTFDYNNVILASYPTYDQMVQMIYPDLDAHLPVTLAIENTSDYSAHCILADGYGMDAGTMYTHVNVGWGSYWYTSQSIWYNFADPDITDDNFNDIYQVMYNVYPTGTGEVISGEVLNAAGAYIPGVVVKITCPSRPSFSAQCTSSSHGIYAFDQLPSNTQFSITGLYGSQSDTISATTGDSSAGGPSGNVWAQNLSFAPSPAPILSSISPTSAAGGSARLLLTVTGSRFVSGSVVRWNGSALPTSYSSATKLVALIPATDLDTMGSASVTVFTPSPGGGSSSAAAFSITTPAPVLSSILPASASLGSGRFFLTVHGSWFMPRSVVHWNGAALPTDFVSGTELIAIVPADMLTTLGTAEITVATGAPGGGTSSAAAFSIVVPAPILSSLSPSSIPAGSARFLMTLNGSWFMPRSVVEWDGYALPTTFVSGNKIEAVVLAPLIATPGGANMTVVTPAPGGGTSEALRFVYK